MIKYSLLLLILMLSSTPYALADSLGNSPLPQNTQTISKGADLEPVDLGQTLRQRFMTGKNDLPLFVRPDKFEVKSSTSLELTDNAFYSDDFKKGDLITTQTTSARFSTLIDEKYNVFTETGVQFNQYADHTELNNDVYFVRGGISRPIGNFIVGGVASGDFVHRQWFGDKAVHLLSGSAYASYIKPIGTKTILQPKVILGGSVANPDDFTNANLTVGLDVLHPINDKVTIFYGASGFGRAYPKFFDRVLSEDRKDAGMNVDAGIRVNLLRKKRFIDSLDATVSVRFGFMNSNIDVLDYTRFSGSPQINLVARF